MTWLFPIIGVTLVASFRGFKRPEFLRQWLMIPVRVVEQREWHRIITHGFIHSDTTHLFLNMFVLWSFGGTVEDAFRAGELDSPVFGLTGNWTFPILYFGGLVAAALPALTKHRDDPSYASLGASGAVSAVMMAFILMYPTSTLLMMFVIPMPAVVAGLLFFVYESHMNRRGRTRIAHDAHLVGALFGAALVLIYDPGLLPEAVQALRDSIARWF